MSTSSDSPIATDAPIAVVTGANSGIGRATALHLAGQGYTVYGTVRAVSKAAKLEAMAAERGVTVNLIEAEMASDESVAQAFAAVLASTGDRIDVLVNNAGVGSNAVVEESTPQMHLDAMNINLCGPLRCIRAALPSMRARGRGCIVNVTSVTGRIAALAQSPYVTSKWAFEGLCEQLAVEVAPFGVRVVIIEPGVTKSAIFAKNGDVPDSTGAYGAQYRRMFQMYAAGIPNGTDPMEVARLIEHAVTTDQPKLRYACSWGGRELVEGRAAITDEQWVHMGQVEDTPEGDAAYYDAFKQAFALDIAP
jgi:NAD(P)-dependent dehydrogenase (short-subunit alcohol dehydrogenase family)